MTTTVLSVDDYCVAIVCALDKELFAVRALFDQRHRGLPKPPQDPNHYALGQIGTNNIVASSLPVGEYGGNSASSVVTHLLRSFPFVRFCLLVGIGGGAPSRLHDIRLGDVVVSQPTGTSPGVLQYDLGKTMQDGSFVPTGSLQRPPRVLLTAVSSIKSDPDLSANPLSKYIEQIAQLKPDYRYPGRHLDMLFAPDTEHNIAETTCKRCNGPWVKRRHRATTQPVIHYGLIASGNQVVKSPHLRDRLRDEHEILCFEMEAAGAMNSIPCLVIRGISDYADSHENSIWQEYASATAAAYSKLLLTHFQFSIYSSTAVVDRNIEDPMLESPPEENKAMRQIDPVTSPEKRLLECESFARRFPSWDDWPVNAVNLLSCLQQWISAPTSALYVVKTSMADAKRSRDLVFEVTAFLRSVASYRVIYSLSSPITGFDTGFEILRSLISQALLHQSDARLPMIATDRNSFQLAELSTVPDSRMFLHY